MAVDPNIKKKADDIRNKVYGKEVRESLASGLEEMSSDVVENEGRQSVVEGRQDSVESQWQSVSDEMTDKDVISAPEIIAARDGEPNLKTRIDKDHQEVTAQLAQKAKEKNWVNVMDFGAKCDGETDDTEAFKSAISSANNGAVEGTTMWQRVVYVPAVMKIKSPDKILVPGSLSIQGNSRNNSMIVFTEKTGGLEYVKDNGDSPVYEVEIKNTVLSGDGVCDTLITARHVVNFYLTDVMFTKWSEGYAINMVRSGLVFFDKVTIDGGNPTEENKWVKKGIRMETVSFIQCQHFNAWNLSKLFEITTPCYNLIYKYNWTEYVKTIFEINPSVTNFTHNKITYEGNTLTNGQMMEDFSFVDYKTSEDTNLFGNQIGLIDSQFYFNDKNTLLNDTFINIEDLRSGSRVHVNVDRTNIVGWSFNESEKFVKLNDVVVNRPTDVAVLNYNLMANGLDSSTETCSNHVDVYRHVIGKKGQFPSFQRGLKLREEASGTESRISYTDGNFWLGYPDGIYRLPKQSSTSVPQSTADDISGLKDDLNHLITQLKTTGIIK